MPTAKNNRRGCSEKNRKGKLSEKASSFHGRGCVEEAKMIPRPRTVPDLLSGRRSGGSSADDVLAMMTPAKPTKLLLNVTIQRSLGAVRVLLPLEATVEDLIAAALRQYAKEARVPALPSCEGSDFDLHYSQFSLESLDRQAKLAELGSRNFFLCPTAIATTSRCSKEADKAAKGSSWLKFMDLLK